MAMMEEDETDGSASSCMKTSDEESSLSHISIDDGLSGRSTPPSKCRSTSSVASNNKSKLSSSGDSSSSIESMTIRPSPLPPVAFADCREIWNLMCQIDSKYDKPRDIFANHPKLSAQMRAILLDWIMDVCEAYNLHRETLYLAIDYLDRYLAAQRHILKNHLQLIGKFSFIVNYRYSYWYSLVN